MPPEENVRNFLPVWNIFGAINQFETVIRAERQTDGIIKAKEKGVKFGANKKLTVEQVAEMREKRQSGVLIKNLMVEYKLSKASVYRYLEISEARRITHRTYLIFKDNCFIIYSVVLSTTALTAKDLINFVSRKRRGNVSSKSTNRKLQAHQTAWL